MSNIHLIGGEKGGIGKSLVSRLVAQYFIDRAIPFIGFDSDRSHGALLRFYAGYASPVIIERYDSLDPVAEAAIENPGKRVLVDLAAQTQEPLSRWIEACGLLEPETGLGLKLRYWHVMDSGHDSTDLLGRLLDRFGTKMDYVIVLNQVRGEEFGILDRSGERERAASMNAQFITIRQLPEPIVNRIDAHGTSFWAATQNANKETGGFGVLERQRVKFWVNHAYEQFDRLGL
jgi:hypothetical protein